MQKDYILFLLTTVLMAIHVIYGTIAADQSMLFSFSLFIFPYLVVSSIWYKLKDIYKISVIIVFIILELNYAATNMIPELIKNGLDAYTLDVIFFIPSILFMFVILIMLVIGRVRKQRDEKQQPWL